MSNSALPAPTIATTPSPTVAFLGLGAMGARMAARLLEAGVTLRVYNRSEGPAKALAEKGATAAATPAEAATGAQVVVNMVTDDDAAHRVLLGENGALSALEKGAVIVESSTVTPAFVAKLSTEANAKGVHVMDAPVAGSRPQAEAGTLISLVGADTPVLDAVRPLLEHTGGAIHHAGPVGSGAKMKLIVNGLFAAQVAALAEAFGSAQAQDLDVATAAEILGALPTTAPAMKGAAMLMLTGNDAPLFPVDLVTKDLRYYVGSREEAASDRGEAMPLATATWRVFERAQAAGLGGQNLTAIRRLFTTTSS